MALAPPTIDAPSGIEDELRGLDALLSAAVARQRAEGRWRGEDDLRGVYTSPDLAAAVLAGRASGWADADAELRLREALHGGAASESSGELEGDDGLEGGSAHPDAASPLQDFAAAFGLDAFERFALLLALAPEIDSRYRTVLGCLNDDVGQGAPTVALALDLFAGAGPRSAPLRRAFRARAPLVRYRLLRLRAAPPAPGSLLRCGLEVDDWVVARALGDRGAPDGVDGWCDHEQALRDGEPGGGDARIAAEPLVVVGADLRAARDAALDAAGRGQLVVDLAAAGAQLSATEALLLAARRARLDAIGLTLVAADVREDAELLRLVGELAHDGLAIMVTAAPGEADALPDAWPRLRLAAVSPAQRRERWSAGLAAAGVPVADEAPGAVSVSHPIALDRIDAAVTRLAAESRGERRTSAELQAAARAVARHRLGGLARRIAPGRSWSDLVLAPRTQRQLEQIAAAIADRAHVLDDWGFGARAGGRGTHLLFSGPSGTGKTLAAAVIAEEAGYALYAVDLARVVDKYIGETEKQLDRVFEEALAAGAVLLFDEADALFGRRAEVHDARDRYANVEVAYLLQRLEAHDGVTILATNLGHHLDPAFARRLHHRVDFAMPDAALRERLWNAMLPDAAPREPDLNLALVAERFELAGGAIRGAALGAAYLAAAARRPIATDDVVRAVARELEKGGRPATRAEFRELYDALSRDT